MLVRERNGLLEGHELGQMNDVQVPIGGERGGSRNPTGIDRPLLVCGALDRPPQESPRANERVYWSPSRASRTSVTASGNTCAITERSCSVC